MSLPDVIVPLITGANVFAYATCMIDLKGDNCHCPKCGHAETTHSVKLEMTGQMRNAYCFSKYHSELHFVLVAGGLFVSSFRIEINRSSLIA